MAGAYGIFQAAERIEALASELYLALADRFAGDAGAVALFRRLADEEVQHAARIRLAFAQYRNDAHLFDGAVALRAAPPDLVALTAGMSAAVEDARRGGWGASLDDVARRAAELEERCAEVHAELLLAGADPSVTAFFEELARQDREHRRLLVELAAARRG